VKIERIMRHPISTRDVFLMICATAEEATGQAWVADAV
jgi:hypothetical protein